MITVLSNVGEVIDFKSQPDFSLLFELLVWHVWLKNVVSQTFKDVCFRRKLVAPFQKEITFQD